MTLTCYLLLKDWGVIVHEDPAQSNDPKEQEKTTVKHKALPTEIQSESRSPKRNNTLFKDINLKEITKCFPNFSSNNPQDLSELAQSKEENLIFTSIKQALCDTRK